MNKNFVLLFEVLLSFLKLYFKDSLGISRINVQIAI